MNFYKGTKAKCEEYDAMVTSSQNYQGTTTKWADPIERDGDFYIRKHPDYPATSGLVEADLPPDPEDTDVI